jgi:hypothetical protein
VASINACATAPSSGGSAGKATPTSPSARDSATQTDIGGSNLIPAGYGSLRQDDIALKVELPGVLVKAIPLDESITRVLAPDSYRSLHELVGSARARIDSLALRAGVRGFAIWYISFYGLTPDARFSPTDVIMTAVGRDFRPVHVLPLTNGFGEQRLAQRATQAAIFLFDERLDASQPVVFSVGAARNADWIALLRVIDRERAMIRSRVRPPPA